VDAAWRNLIASSHGVDVILLGETAPYGPKDPRKPGTNGLLSAVNFVKELYCLRRSYRPYKGQPARARNCPATAAERRGFRRAHPGLFAATGWAHHPYSLENRPTWRGRRRDASPLGAIGRLTRALDRAQFHWGAEGQMDVWITEYGYQTQPPDPYRGVPWSRQAAWMSWAEFLAWRNPRVASFSQFLLHDDAPDARYSRRSPKYWVTWQSGLLTHHGRRKPALAEYARPIHVTPRRARRGRKVRVFSTYRPAADRTPMRAYILFRPRGGEWRILRNVRVTNLRGYLNAFVRSPGRGRLRVVWAVPGVGYKASRGVLIGR
jgi:hypothetical protein